MLSCRASALLACAMIALGCGGDSRADERTDGGYLMGSDASRAGEDSGVSEDAGSDVRDAAVNDAHVPPVDSGAPEAGSLDAGVDAGSCDCTPSSPCVTATCETGACVEAPVPDGILCGEADDHVCVDGACVARACGDGYREPASSSLREGCDDGNTEDGDLCSPDCEPVAGLVAYDPTGDRHARLAPQGPSVGVDGAGRVLFVWQEDGLIPDRAMAQRATRGGVPVGDPIVIDPDVGSPPVADPRVAGLAGGGWVVVWEELGSTDFDVRYRLVSVDGSPGGVRTAHLDDVGRQFEARVAALSDGFVIAWSAAVTGGSGGDFTVHARRFGATGAPVGGELEVPTDTTNVQGQAALASSGDRWLVAWRDRAMSIGATARLYLRRYEGGTALDPAQVELSEGGADAYATVLDSGEFLVVWADGDIHSQIVARDALAPAAADHALVTTTSVAERFPVAAPLTGRDFVVGWVEQSAFDPVRFGASDPAALAPEASTLETRLEAGAEKDVSMAPSPDGVWLVWSGFDGLTPARGISAFHLPLD